MTIWSFIFVLILPAWQNIRKKWRGQLFISIVRCSIPHPTRRYQIPSHLLIVPLTTMLCTSIRYCVLVLQPSPCLPASTGVSTFWFGVKLKGRRQAVTSMRDLKVGRVRKVRFEEGSTQTPRHTWHSPRWPEATSYCSYWPDPLHALHGKAVKQNPY